MGGDIRERLGEIAVNCKVLARKGLVQGDIRGELSMRGGEWRQGRQGVVPDHFLFSRMYERR